VSESSLAKAVAYLEVDQPHRALPLLQSHLASHPHDARALTSLAQAHVALRNYAEARDTAKEAIALAPDDAHAMRLLAISHAHLRERYAAVWAATEAQRLAPHDWASHYVRVSIDVNGDRFSEAGRNAIVRLVELGPDSADGLAMAAGHLLRGYFPSANERTQARGYITTALEIDPQHTYAQYLLGYLETRSVGRTTRGLGPILDSLEGDPTDAHNRGVLEFAVNTHVRWLACVFFVLLLAVNGFGLLHDETAYSIACAIAASLCVVSTFFYVFILVRTLGKRTPDLLRRIPKLGVLFSLRLAAVFASFLVLVVCPFVPYSILGWFSFFLPAVLYATDVLAGFDARRTLTWRQQWREWVTQ
jgi:tetratricopeptide (TPR) repeat protein